MMLNQYSGKKVYSTIIAAHGAVHLISPLEFFVESIQYSIHSILQSFRTVDTTDNNMIY